MGRHKPILAVGVALILLATLTSYVYRDLAKIHFFLPHCTSENIDEECPAVLNAKRDDRCGSVFFSVFPQPHGGLPKEHFYSLPDMFSLCQKNLVLRHWCKPPRCSLFCLVSSSSCDLSQKGPTYHRNSMDEMESKARSSFFPWFSAIFQNCPNFTVRTS
jgi:hypothetical protein